MLYPLITGAPRCWVDRPSETGEPMGMRYVVSGCARGDCGLGDCLRACVPQGVKERGLETARTVADAFGLLAGTVVEGGCADCRGQRVGDGKIRGGDAAEGASCAGDFGHHGAAAGQPVDGVAVGD